MAAALIAPALTVLLVDDDEADVALVEDYFERRSLPGDLYRVADGVEAMAFLRREMPFPDVPRPDLVLLDLNMPRMDGREFLRVVKDPQSQWKSIPVIVFTTSAAQEDIARSYDAHANAFVTKSIGYDEFQNALSKIDEFFGEVASLDRDPSA